MSLEIFKGKIRKDRTKKRIIYTMLSLCLLTSLIITSYAIYKIQQDKDVSNTKVGEFKTSDIQLAVLVDGVRQSEFPAKDSGKVFEKLECTNSGSGTFNESTWTLSIDGITAQTECSVYFKTKTDYIDASGASSPDLEAGMIPVTWDGTNWIVADKFEKWYDYDAQWWANAINVTSSSRENYTNKPGTTVNMDDVLFMWVWIPRYEYQYTNLGTQYAGGTKAQPGGISIKFIDKSVTTPDTNYYIHDAFWWDDNNDGVKSVNEQLSGIWVAKFELSAAKSESNTLQFPKSKPNVYAWQIAQLGTYWTSINQLMNSETNNTYYGLSITSDTHMMKNMEWGAVAYLSQSKYGKYGNSEYSGANKEIYHNNSSSYFTGISSGAPGSKSAGDQFKYNVYLSGTGASTTGNIYGVYDMSGGAFEYVMGVQKVNGLDEPAVGNTSAGYNSGNQSGFAGKYYDGTVASGTTYVALSSIGRKYYDLYESDSSTTSLENRYHPGDATFETASWYGNNTYLVSSNKVFVKRGGYYNNAGGIFRSESDYGSASGGLTTRAVSIRLS